MLNIIKLEECKIEIAKKGYFLNFNDVSIIEYLKVLKAKILIKDNDDSISEEPQISENDESEKRSLKISFSKRTNEGKSQPNRQTENSFKQNPKQKEKRDYKIFKKIYKKIKDSLEKKAKILNVVQSVQGNEGISVNLQFEGYNDEIENLITFIKEEEKKYTKNICKFVEKSFATKLGILLEKSEISNTENIKTYNYRNTNITIRPLYYRKIIKNDQNIIKLKISQKFSQLDNKDCWIIYPHTDFSHLCQKESEDFQLLKEEKKKIEQSDGTIIEIQLKNRPVFYVNKVNEKYIENCVSMADVKNIPALKIFLTGVDKDKIEKPIQKIIQSLFKFNMIYNSKNIEEIEFIVRSNSLTPGWHEINKNLSVFKKYMENGQNFIEYFGESTSIVKFHNGDLSKQSTDVIGYIDPNNSSKELKSQIQKSLANAAGQQLEKEYASEKSKNTFTNILITKGHNLKCKAIFHMKLKKYIDDNSLKVKSASFFFNVMIITIFLFHRIYGNF